MRYFPEYTIWQGIKKRCTKPKEPAFKNYGGRGILVYDRWLKSFPEFYEHVGPRPTTAHTIERIDNNIGYFPGNIKWATRGEQNNNTRKSRKIAFCGKTMTMTKWANEMGISVKTLRYRIDTLGWPIEKAFNQPVKGH